MYKQGNMKYVMQNTFGSSMWMGGIETGNAVPVV